MSAETIRPGSPQDVPRIHDLLVGLAAELGHASDMVSTRQDLSAFGFSKSPMFRTMVATESGRMKGLVVYFQEFSTWKGRPGVFIQDLYVIPEARGTGLGRRLLEAVKADASGWGAVYMKLTVHGEQPGAVAFYRRLGFQTREDELTLVLTDL